MAFEKPWFCLGKDFKKEFMRAYKNVLAEIWTVCVGLCSPWAKHILLESSSLKTGFAWRRQLARGLLLGLGRGACAVGPGGLIWRHLSPGWAPGSLLASSSFLLYWFEVNRKHSQASIVIIRSECHPWICTVEITPRWGHNKSGPFLLLSLFFPFAWIPAGTQNLRPAECSQNCVISVYLLRNP